MSAWKLALAVLCGVGFLKEVDILGVFQDVYLQGTYNLTEAQLQYEVYPVYSYAYACIIIVVLLVTDLVYYKPIISLGILALITHSALITWGRGLLVAQLALFTSAFSATTDIAFYSYAFAVVDPEKYRMAAGFSRAALLTGRLTGYAVGQLLVHIFHTNYSILNYVTLGLLCLAVVVSVFIPSAVLSAFQQVIERELQSPEHGQFQNPIAVQGGNVSIQNTHIQRETPVKRGDNSVIPRTDDVQNTSLDSTNLAFPPGPMFCDIDTSSLGFSYNDMMSECSDMSSLDRTRLDDSQQLDMKDVENIKEKFMLSVNSVKETYSSVSVIIWSVFWIILTFINFQVGATIRPFLDERGYQEWDSFRFFGAVESVSLFIGIILVLLVSFMKVNWTNTSFLMCATCLVLGLLLTLIAALTNLWMNICMYAAFRVMYQVLMTLAMFQVATQVSGRRFAFVFGINMLVSGVLELVFVGARAGDKDVGFTLIDQFSLYAGIFGILGFLLLIRSIYYFVVRRRNGSDEDVRDDLDTLVQE